MCEGCLAARLTSLLVRIAPVLVRFVRTNTLPFAFDTFVVSLIAMLAAARDSRSAAARVKQSGNLVYAYTNEERYKALVSIERGQVSRTLSYALVGIAVCVLLLDCCSSILSKIAVTCNKRY